MVHRAGRNILDGKIDGDRSTDNTCTTADRVRHREREREGGGERERERDFKGRARPLTRGDATK